MHKHTQHEKNVRRGMNTVSYRCSFHLNDADLERNNQHSRSSNITQTLEVYWMRTLEPIQLNTDSLNKNNYSIR